MTIEGQPRGINPQAYDFIESIAKTADERLFPGTTHYPLIVDSRDATKIGEQAAVIISEADAKRREDKELADGRIWKSREVWKEWVPTKSSWLSGTALRQQMIAALPEEMAGEIVTYARNFSDLVIMLGLTNPKVKMPENVVEIGAADLLKRMPEANRQIIAEHPELSHLSSKEKLLACAVLSVIGTDWTEQLPSITSSHPLTGRGIVARVYLAGHWKLRDMYEDETRWSDLRPKIVAQILEIVILLWLRVSTKILPFIVHEDFATLVRATILLLYWAAETLGLWVWKPMADRCVTILERAGIGQHDHRRPRREQKMAFVIRTIIALSVLLFALLIGSVLTIPAMGVILWDRAWFSRAWSQLSFSQIQRAFMHQGTLLTHIAGTAFFLSWVSATGLGIIFIVTNVRRSVDGTLQRRVIPWHDTYGRHLNAKRTYIEWMHFMQHPEDLYLPLH